MRTSGRERSPPLFVFLEGQMAWWLTVYCRKSVAGLTAEDVRKGLLDLDPAAPAGVDYMTLAEDYDVDEELVEPALEALKIDGPGLTCSISYREDRSLRPIQVHLWNTPERVAEELEEIENREPSERAMKRLEGVVEIVGIELGFPMLENMGVVLAYELARWLAQRGDGVIADDDHRWQVIERGGFQVI